MKDDDPRHGTTNGYNNLKCRCQPCRNAWASDVASSKERRSQRPIPNHVHGTQNGYGNYKCRCAACTRVWSSASTARNKRRIARKQNERTN